MKWWKVAANNPRALREFADFLQGSVEAIPRVKGLSIINDCEENHRLLKKTALVDCAQMELNVVEELDKSGDYASSLSFTLFVQKEARIALNPTAFPLTINIKQQRRGY